MEKKNYQQQIQPQQQDELSKFLFKYNLQQFEKPSQLLEISWDNIQKICQSIDKFNAFYQLRFKNASTTNKSIITTTKYKQCQLFYIDPLLHMWGNNINNNNLQTQSQ